MFTDHLLNGTWKGFYQYHVFFEESEEPESDKPEIDEVKYYFEVRFESDDESFVGIATEENTNFEKPIMVKGFFQEGFISFEKLYPYLWFVDEHGNQVFDPLKPHPKIYYSGNIESDNQRISGEWQMTDETNSYITGFEDYYTGIWELTKIS